MVINVIQLKNEHQFERASRIFAPDQTHSATNCATLEPDILNIIIIGVNSWRVHFLFLQ